MRRGSRRGSRQAAKCRFAGFVYLAMLGCVAAFAVATAVAATAWQSAARRDREQQLLRVGAAYAAAIKSFRRHAPGSAVMNPRTLEELVSDSRFPRPVRHLRRQYADPTKPQAPWVLIRDAEGRIAGLHSSNHDAPLRVTPIDLGVVRLAAARKYSDWKFVVQETRR